MTGISLDPLLSRLPEDGYNCLDFACEVWTFAVGEDLARRLHGLHGAFAERKVSKLALQAFRSLERPESPCLVLLHRPHTIPHVGVYLDGRVWHLSETHAEAIPLEAIAIGCSHVRYYQ